MCRRTVSNRMCQKLTNNEIDTELFLTKKDSSIKKIILKQDNKEIPQINICSKQGSRGICITENKIQNSFASNSCTKVNTKNYICNVKPKTINLCSNNTITKVCATKNEPIQVSKTKNLPLPTISLDVINSSRSLVINYNTWSVYSEFFALKAYMLPSPPIMGGALARAPPPLATHISARAPPTT